MLPSRSRKSRDNSKQRTWCDDHVMEWKFLPGKFQVYEITRSSPPRMQNAVARRALTASPDADLGSDYGVLKLGCRIGRTSRLRRTLPCKLITRWVIPLANTQGRIPVRATLISRCDSSARDPEINHARSGRSMLEKNPSSLPCKLLEAESARAIKRAERVVEKSDGNYRAPGERKNKLAHEADSGCWSASRSPQLITSVSVAALFRDWSWLRSEAERSRSVDGTLHDSAKLSAKFG